MATRLIGDELDFNLSSLATGLVIVVVIIISSRWSLAFGSTTFN
jgi:hypothetical protein